MFLATQVSFVFSGSLCESFSLSLLVFGSRSAPNVQALPASRLEETAQPAVKN